MYVKESTEYQNPLVVINMIEDKVGGGTIAKADLVSTDELKPGAVVGEDSNGLLHVVKTLKVYEAAANNETAYKVYKGHEAKVGDVVSNNKFTGASVSITAIDASNASYDAVTVGATIGVALAVGDVLVQASATAAAGAGTYKYAPIGITLAGVDLSVANQQVGVMVRGTVKESILPYPLNAGIKEKLSLIRFV
jgi:hypothetical protein